MPDMSVLREHMVRYQIAARGVSDDRVLDAMRAVPREAFMPEELAEFAYEDTPLPIAEGQTISQPYIVALMIAAIQPGPQDEVLEVGTGSGYAAAVLSQVVGQVYTIERQLQFNVRWNFNVRSRRADPLRKRSVVTDVSGVRPPRCSAIH